MTSRINHCLEFQGFFSFSTNQDIDISTGSCGSNSHNRKWILWKRSTQMMPPVIFSFSRDVMVQEVGVKNCSFHRETLFAAGCIFTRRKDLIYIQITQGIRGSFQPHVGLSKTFPLMVNGNPLRERALLQRVNE